MSPSPITHHGPATLCWGTNVWDCSDPLTSFQGRPHVSLHCVAAPGVGPGCGAPGKGFGCLFLQHPGAKKKLHPLWVTITVGSEKLPRLR